MHNFVTLILLCTDMMQPIFVYQCWQFFVRSGKDFKVDQRVYSCSWRTTTLRFLCGMKNLIAMANNMQLVSTKMFIYNIAPDSQLQEVLPCKIRFRIPAQILWRHLHFERLEHDLGLNDIHFSILFLCLTRINHPAESTGTCMHILMSGK